MSTAESKTLTDKITSLEELQLVTTFRDRDMAKACLNTDESNVPFWAIREQARINSGFYGVTESLKYLNQRAPVFAHISKKDKKMVAFTPDKAAAEADRQIISTPARLFSRYLPLISDKRIAEMLAEHEAEASAEITWFSGMEIPEMYKQFRSIGACMSNVGSEEKFKEFEHHPTEVYDAPNVRLATLKDKNGKFVARTLVYEPSPTDKRYIRLYGSKTLTSLLQQEGYKIGSFVGAKLKLLKKHDDTYYVPYIDSNGGYASDSHSSVAAIDGELVVVTPEQKKLLKTINIHPVTASNSGGTQQVPTVTWDMSYTCAILGQKFSLFEMPAVSVFWKGEVTKACKSLVHSDAFEHTCKPRFDMAMYLGSSIFAMPEDIIQCENRYIVKSAQNMLHYGMRLLSDTYYPEEEWAKDWVETNAGFIKKADSVYLFSVAKREDRTLVHKSSITKSNVLLAPYFGNKCYAIDKSLVSRTSSGRKVIEGVHEVVRDVHGKLEYSNKCTIVNLLNGSYVYILKTESVDTLIDSKALSAVKDFLTTVTIEKLMSLASAGRYSRYSSVYFQSPIILDGGLTVGGYRDFLNLPSIVGYNPVRNYEAIFRVMIGNGYGDNIERFLQKALVKREFYARMADMQAVEAPHYLVDMPVEPAPQIVEAEEIIEFN